jgi:gliding motility-associated protein GldE
LDAWAASLLNRFQVEWVSAGATSHAISFLITVVGVTFLLVLFGEVAPKIYANINNINHAKRMAGPLLVLNNLFFPISGVLVRWSGNIEESVYRKRLTAHNVKYKQELDKAIELTVSDESEKDDVDILKGIIKFGDVITKHIMKSRVDVTALDIKSNYGEVMNTIKESGFSRLPVYRESFDNIEGILYVKDLIGNDFQRNSSDWQELIRKNVLYAPETKNIDELLKEFQQKRTHMAVVVDEYGGCAGIVTLEDIMEEVVGEIKDEFDQDEEVDYMKIDDNNYLFDGKTLLNDVSRIIGVDSDVFDEGRGLSDSLAGLVLELEGFIPKRDKVIHYKNLKFKIVSVSQRRIEKINITL